MVCGVLQDVVKTDSVAAILKPCPRRSLAAAAAAVTLLLLLPHLLQHLLVLLLQLLQHLLVLLLQLLRCAAAAAAVAVAGAVAVAAAAAAVLRRPRTPHKMECGLVLDVVLRQCAVILKLLVCEGQPLLVCRNFFHSLDHGLDKVNGVRCVGVQVNGLACVSLHKDQHGKDLFGLDGLEPVDAHNYVGQMLV